MVFCL
jgi:hypothetical protein